MKSGFKDPIGVPKDENKRLKSPWNFNCPHYDERSSCYVNAGSHYGVGHNQPVGHTGNAKQKVDVLPMDGRVVKTMKVAEVPRRNLPLDIQQ